ncbi:hypothetical protein JYU02_01525 [bacterium AH-315-P15]|nr:hypothetical protein [bacterium AH-315-P15]
MQRVEAPKIQLPPGSRDVIQGPGDKQRANKQRINRDAARGRGRRRWRGPRLQTILVAVGLSVLWLAVFGAFIYGFYDASVVPLLSLPPMIWGGLVAAALLPVGFIWVGAAVFLRLTQISEDAMRLATISRELIDPSTTAANDVAKLGAVIRKELDGLNREVDGAVARVGMLEGRLKQQTKLIDETGKRVDKRTTDMTSRLSEEREKVDAVTRTLSSEGRIIAETLDVQARAIDLSAEKATKALRDAEEGLEKRTAGLDKAAGEAAETTKTIAEDIGRETGKLESVAANARSRSEVITARFAEQHKLMVEAVDMQAEQQTKLEAAMEQQHRLIGKMSGTVSRQIATMAETVGQQTSKMAEAVAQQIQRAENNMGQQTATMAEVVAQQVERIETTVAEAGTNFQDAVEAARARAVQAGAGFEDQAAAMTSAADAAAAKLDDAVETVKLLSAQTREDLDTQVRTADALFQQQAEAARKLLRTQADELGAALETSLTEMKSRMTEFADQGNEAMVARANELDDALRRSEQRMRALYQRLDASIRGVTEGSDSVGKQLAETADAFEARMAQFPAHAEDAANKVRTQINSQIEQLAKLADSAAERAQALAHTKEEPAKAEEVAPETKAEEPARAEARLPSTAARPAPVTPPEEEPPAPHLPGRDVYPAIWDGMERPGGRRSRMGRPKLGSFDDLAKSLAGRFRPGNRSQSGVPAGIQAAQSTGAVKQAQEEDISDFRVIRHDPQEPAAKGPDAKMAESERKAPPKPGDVDLSRPAPEPLKRAAPKFEERGWKDILASVDRREAERADAVNRTAGGDDASFQRDALLIIEKLQAMSIDLDRALEDAPSAELLDRYMTGERNVFARRLATFTGPEMLEKIARKYREDAEFRADVSRYIDAFEELLKAARGRDRENILLETYLTSQTGKVYMILGTAIGHLKQ